MNKKNTLLAALAVIVGVFILIISLPDRSDPPLPVPLVAAPGEPIPGRVPETDRFRLHGIIGESAGHAGSALIAEGDGPALHVSEGGELRPGVRLERVLPDRVLLRLDGVAAPIELTLAVTVASTPELLAPPPLATSTGSGGDHELPGPPRGSAPPIQPATLPRDRVAAPIDASGPPPGTGLTGPALSGPSPGGSTKK